MNAKDFVLTKTQQFIRQKLANDYSGHDYWHIERVVINAKKILEKEKANEKEVLLVAWLHDIGDYKLHNGIDRTQAIVSPFLKELGFNSSFITKIIQTISEVSFKGGHNSPPTSIEAKIVQDADRLDAIGAIGIARTFAYGGSKGRAIYNPEEKIAEYTDSQSYQKSTSCGINHFYEKLLKLKDLMNTQTARDLAEERHAFMLQYLKQFYEEIGEDKIKLF